MVKPSTLGFRRNRREEHHKPRGTHAFVGKFVFILLIYLGLRVRGHGAYGRLAANFGVLSEHMPLRCGDSSFSSYFIVRFLGAIPRKVRNEKKQGIENSGWWCAPDFLSFNSEPPARRLRAGTLDKKKSE